MRFKAYVSVIFGGMILVAAAVLVILQWAQVAKFSLYGYDFDLIVQDGKITGGVNTAILMLCSALGGVILWWIIKLVWSGVWTIRRARKADERIRKQVTSSVNDQLQQKPEE